MSTLPRGRVIFNEGEPGDSLYIVTAGKIKLSRRSPDGRENVLAVMGPSDQFGELSVFDPGPRTATATAVTDVKLARMPQPTLRLWIEAHPRDRRAAAARPGPPPAPHQRLRRRPDLHRRPRPRRQGTAADGRPVRQPRVRAACA